MASHGGFGKQETAMPVKQCASTHLLSRLGLLRVSEVSGHVLTPFISSQQPCLTLVAPVLIPCGSFSCLAKGGRFLILLLLKISSFLIFLACPSLFSSVSLIVLPKAQNECIYLLVLSLKSDMNFAHFEIIQHLPVSLSWFGVCCCDLLEDLAFLTCSCV